MIKDFFIRKESIFISLVAIISIFFVVLGFLFLFLRPDSKVGPRIIPNTVNDIVWATFSSKILKSKLQYPEYMHVSEQTEADGVGITIAEFEPREFLTYFSNQNHVSIYPSGLDNQFFYSKTKGSDYASESGQEYVRTEYLTSGGKVWATMLVPKITPKNWQPRGFIWIQSEIKNLEISCTTSRGALVTAEECDPYAGNQPVYEGNIGSQFEKFGYEIINKNTF